MELPTLAVLDEVDDTATQVRRRVVDPLPTWLSAAAQALLLDVLGGLAGCRYEGEHRAGQPQLAVGLFEHRRLRVRSFQLALTPTSSEERPGVRTGSTGMRRTRATRSRRRAARGGARRAPPLVFPGSPAGVEAAGEACGGSLRGGDPDLLAGGEHAGVEGVDPLDPLDHRAGRRRRWRPWRRCPRGSRPRRPGRPRVGSGWPGRVGGDRAGAPEDAEQQHDGESAEEHHEPAAPGQPHLRRRPQRARPRWSLGCIRRRGRSSWCSSGPPGEVAVSLSVSVLIRVREMSIGDHRQACLP